MYAYVYIYILFQYVYILVYILQGGIQCPDAVIVFYTLAIPQTVGQVSFPLAYPLARQCFQCQCLKVFENSYFRLSVL